MALTFYIREKLLAPNVLGDDCPSTVVRLACIHYYNSYSFLIILIYIIFRRDKLYDERMRGMENEQQHKEQELLGIIEMLKAQLGSAKEETKRSLEQLQNSRCVVS